jgi:hypothetical protein
MYPYLLQGDKLTVLVNNRQHTLTRSSHPNFDKIVDAIRNEQWDKVPDLVDMSRAVANYAQGLLEVRGGDVYWDGVPMHNALTDRLLRLLEESLPVTPLVNALHKLKCNPSKRAVDELYGFLEKNTLPLTPDGCIVAYKKIRNNWMDCHSGKVLNKPASLMTQEEIESFPYTVDGVTADVYYTDDGEPRTVISMPRNMVDDDKDRTCSTGLHFCSLEYLPQFGTGDADRVVLVKVNPADVVSIPTDHNEAKARTCRYEVLEEYVVEEGKDRDRTDAFKSVVYGDAVDDGELEDDFDDEEDSDSWSSLPDYDPDDILSFSDEDAPREVVKTYDRNGKKQYRYADNGLYTSRAAYEEWKEYRDANGL